MQHLHLQIFFACAQFFFICAQNSGTKKHAIYMFIIGNVLYIITYKCNDSLLLHIFLYDGFDGYDANTNWSTFILTSRVILLKSI